MRSIILLVTAFGLVISAAADTTPDVDGPCEFETEDPCYQAVYSLSSSVCGTYGAYDIPTACNGDGMALQSACACLSDSTVSDETVTKTQVFRKNTNSKGTEIASNTNTQQVYDSAPATYATAGNGIPESGTLPASMYDIATATDSIPLAAYTWSGPRRGAPSVPVDYEVGSTDSGTTTLASSHRDAALGNTFTTYLRVDSTPVVVTSGAISPSTILVGYPTGTESPSTCPEYVKDCEIGSDSPHIVTGTGANSDNIYPLPGTKAETSIDYVYTTETVWSTDVYLVTDCPLSVVSCPRSSTTRATYPVSTTAYRVPKGQPAGPSNYVYTATSMTYITETVYFTKVHTVSEESSYDCVYNPSTTWISPSTATLTTSFKQSFNYPASVTTEYPSASGESYHLTGDGKLYAPPGVLVRSQPSAVIPYSRPGATGKGAEVTAGTTRLGVQVVVATALGILTILLS